MRITIYIIILIFFIIPVIALEECPRFGTLQEDIPCTQPSSWKPSTGCIADVSVYNSDGLNVLNSTWYDYTPYCAFNMTNLTIPDIYCYNSTIEDGCVTLERENNMLAITLAIGIIILFFFALGFLNKTFKLKIFSFGIGLVEILVMFSLLYAREIGNDISGLMRVNFFSLIILGFGVGMISLIMFSLNTMNMGDNQENKWETKNKWER